MPKCVCLARFSRLLPADRGRSSAGERCFGPLGANDAIGVAGWKPAPQRWRVAGGKPAPREAGRSQQPIDRTRSKRISPVHVVTKIFIVLVSLLAVLLVPLVVVYAHNEDSYKAKYEAERNNA